MNKIFFKRILMILLCLLMVSVGLYAGDPLKTFASDEDTTRGPNEFSGIAYAVFDSSDGSLKLFRDEEGAYNDNQVEGTKTYYADIEVRNMALYAPWFGKRNEIRSFSIKEGDTIRPDTCNSWFLGCTDLTDCDLKGLDTSEASSLESMFEGCSSLNVLDFSGFDTSNVANMNCMFQNCSSLIRLDLSMFDTSKLTSIGQMFNGCSSLVELDISSFDLSRVTVYNAIFSNSAVTLIKLGPDFRFISGFFAVPLQRVKLSDDATKVKEPIVYSGVDYTGEAPGWYRVGGQIIGVFDSNDGSLRFVEDTECEHLLGGTEGSKTYYTNILNTENSNPPWYDKRTEIKSVSFEAETAPVTCYRWFYGCNKMTSCNITKLDTSHVKSMFYMFYNCASLTSLDLSNFDTSEVTNMKNMFSSCRKIYKVGLGEKSIFTASIPSSSWKRYKLLNGDQADGPGFVYLNNYDGTSPGWYRLDGSYLTAVFDSSDGSLSFFNDYDDVYENEQVIGTKTYFTNVGRAGYPPWENLKGSIRRVDITERIKPNLLENWFGGCTLLTSLDLSNLVFPELQFNALEGCTSLTRITLDIGEGEMPLNAYTMLSGIWKNTETGEERQLYHNGDYTQDVLTTGTWELVTTSHVTLDMDASALGDTGLFNGAVLKVYHTLDGEAPYGDPIKSVGIGEDSFSFNDPEYTYISDNGGPDNYDYVFVCESPGIDVTAFKEQSSSKTDIKYLVILKNTAMTKISGPVTWIGDKPNMRPESVTVELCQNGSVIERQTVTADKGWKYSFAVPAADENGALYKYEVKEAPVDGYFIEYETADAIRFQFSTMDSPMEKIWFRRDCKWFQMNVPFFGGVLTVPGDAVYLDKLWEPAMISGVTFIKMPQEAANIAESWEDAAAGTEIPIDDWLASYDNVEGATQGMVVPLNKTDSQMEAYVKEAVGNDLEWTFISITDPYPLNIPYDGNYLYRGTFSMKSITNVSRQGVTEKSGIKIWDGHDHPDEITLVLNRNGEEFRTERVSKEDGWKYSFTDIPMYDDNGREYEYTVTERPVKGYVLTKEIREAEDLTKAVRIRFKTSRKNMPKGFFVSYDNLGRAYRYKQKLNQSRDEHTVIFPTMDLDLAFILVNIAKGMRSQWDDSGIVTIQSVELVDSPYEYIEGRGYVNANDENDSWEPYDPGGETHPYPDRGKLYHYGEDELASLHRVSNNKYSIIPYTIALGKPWEVLINEYYEGQFKVLKTDPDGIPLKNARFGLYFTECSLSDENWTKSEETATVVGTTGEDGHISWNNVPYGCYLLEEIDAPPKYATKNGYWKVVIRKDGKAEVYDKSGRRLTQPGEELVIENEKTETIIKKVGEDGELLAGASLGLYDKNNQEVASWISGSDTGFVVYGLTEGETYTLKEIEPPEEYEKAADVRFVVEKGKTTVVTMTDRKLVFPIPTGADWEEPLGIMVASALGILFLFLRKAGYKIAAS